MNLTLESVNAKQAASIGEARLKQKLKVNDLYSTLKTKHTEASESLVKTRRQALEKHNSKSHIVPYKPTVVEYVVVASTKSPRTNMFANWVGPLRIACILYYF